MVNNSLGMGEQAVGSKWQMLAKAFSEPDNAVTNPGDYITQSGAKQIGANPSILGPQKLSSGRLAHRGDE